MMGNRWLRGYRSETVPSGATGATGATGPAASLNWVVVNRTTSLVLNNSDSYKAFTNTGAGAEVILTAPTASSPFGQIFRLVVTADTKLLRFQAAGAAIIYTGSGQSAAGGYIRSGVLGSAIEVMAVNALAWIVMPKTGTWTLDS